MVHRLNAAAAGFEAAFAAFLAVRREAGADVADTVRRILAAVRADGDAALLSLTEQFDRVRMTPASLRVAAADIDAAWASTGAELRRSLELAAARITAFHRRQLPDDIEYDDEHGNRLGLRWRPIPAVGLYIPGGLAAYPSSVLMNALPARLAGVPRLAMAVPAPDGKLNPLVLAAARLAGVDEIYRMGGAQAVGAFAFGTATVPAVDKIVGPGNAYVAEAKRQVFGQVGIDMVAGPSEILVVADRTADPACIAADLLSQAEHDAAAQAILLTDDAGLADRVEAEVTAQLATLPRAAIASESWARHGAVIVVDDLEAQAPALIDRIAPEHLELNLPGADAVAARVGNAGAIFIGPHTPEAIGDYVGGPNHVLPTGRSARHASGLSVLDFLKRTTLLRCSAAGLAALGPAAVSLAEAEGLPAHARSVAMRLGRRG
jgi:histidinol dehydrogenase